MATLPQIKRPGPKTQIAIDEGRTVFTNLRENPAETHAKGLRVLKLSSNKKLGKVITRGEFAGRRMVTLTLEERKTCPVSCHHWETCYGNNLHRAVRIGTVGLEAALEKDLAGLIEKYPEGIHVRLHVTGDFFSVGYVAFWRRMLKRYPDALSVFGYTARKPSSDIGRAVERLNLAAGSRCRIRFSQNQESTSARPGRVFAAREDFDADKSFVCPQQTGKVASCADCAVCWSGSARTLRFLTH